MNTDNATNTWFLLPSNGTVENSRILCWGPASISKDESLLQQVRLHFDNDARNASLSIGSPNGTKSNEAVRCHLPFGVAFFLNLGLCDLLGGPDQEKSGKSEVLKWGTEAARRGLFNHWAPWLSSDEPISIGLSRPDSLEIRDANTPLGSIVKQTPPEAISILIDCSWLGENETGSQRATVEIIEKLQLSDRVKSILLYGLPNGIPSYAKNLEALSKVKTIKLVDAPYSDILWRPYQPNGDVNFLELNRHAKRIVMTYLDLIAYGNSTYHKTEKSWLAYRNSLRIAAIRCDGIIAISSDVKTQLIENMPCLDESRIYAIPLGTDHIRTDKKSSEMFRKISGVNIESQKYALCLGTNFSHKNRDFAVSVIEEVRKRGLPVDLVFAGLILDPENSGESIEKQQKNQQPEWVKTLGSVNQLDRDWLLENAQVSLYPTSAEGFGLVPFESIAMNVPVVASDFGPLSELLPSEALIEGWNLDGYASAIVELSVNPKSREAQVQEITNKAASLTWATCVNQMVDAFIDISIRERVPSNTGGAEFDTSFNLAQARFNNQVNAITSSISWKVTAPLRKIHKLIVRGYLFSRK